MATDNNKKNPVEERAHAMSKDPHYAEKLHNLANNGGRYEELTASDWYKNLSEDDKASFKYAHDNGLVNRNNDQSDLERLNGIGNEEKPEAEKQMNQDDEVEALLGDESAVRWLDYMADQPTDFEDFSKTNSWYKKQSPERQAAFKRAYESGIVDERFSQKELDGIFDREYAKETKEADSRKKAAAKSIFNGTAFKNPVK